MKRRTRIANGATFYRENPQIDAFLDEVAAISKKYGLSISHEDFHGGFCIEKYSEANIRWLKDAADETEL